MAPKKRAVKDKAVEQIKEAPKMGTAKPSRAVVIAAQRYLKEASLYRGPVDGTWTVEVARGLSVALTGTVTLPGPILFDVRDALAASVPERASISDTTDLVPVGMFGRACKLHADVAGAFVLADAVVRYYASHQPELVVPRVVGSDALSVTLDAAPAWVAELFMGLGFRVDAQTFSWLR